MHLVGVLFCDAKDFLELISLVRSMRPDILPRHDRGITNEQSDQAYVDANLPRTLGRVPLEVDFETEHFHQEELQCRLAHLLHRLALLLVGGTLLVIT